VNEIGLEESIPNSLCCCILFASERKNGETLQQTEISPVGFSEQKKIRITPNGLLIYPTSTSTAMHPNHPLKL